MLSKTLYDWFRGIIDETLGAARLCPLSVRRVPGPLGDGYRHVSMS